MQTKVKAFLLSLVSVCCIQWKAVSQELPFEPGESLTYAVYYYLMGVWVGAGDVTFSVKEDEFMNKPCLNFTGEGKTHPRYEWFYTVRDTYEAYADAQDLSPYRFKRDINEGSFYMKEDCIFDQRRDRVISVLKVKENPIRVDTSDLEDNTFDVLSLIYQARRIDFDKAKPGEKIPIKMFIDRETHDLFIRYQGVEIYNHDEYGEVACHVFSPLLVQGTIFKEGEGMKVYVTKDKNLIPIYVESEIRVGSIRAKLKSTKNLKYPLFQN